MKLTSLKALCLLLACCTSLHTAFAQDKKGNGNVTVTKRNVKAFNTINLDGVFSVVFIQSDEPTIKVETDENLQKNISVKQKGSSIDVSMEGCNNCKPTKTSIFVYCNDMSKINLSVVGNVSSSNELQFRKLSISNESVGNVKLRLKGDYLRANTSAVGNTYFQGTVREAELDVASVGNFDASYLVAETLRIDYSAVGNAEVFASKAFYIDASGIGNLTYHGPGEVKSLDKSNLGKVRKAN